MFLENIIALTIFYAYVLLLPNEGFVNNSTAKCTTPDNKQGQCVLLSECPQLQHELEYMDDPTEKGEYLQSYECDIESDDPKFCCPSYTPEFEYVDTLPGVDVCGQDLEHRIVGGENTSLGEFPWMALLNYATGNRTRFYCGGVLINSRYVLTAAHCVKGKSLRSSDKIHSVRLGEYNISSDIDCTTVAGGELCSSAPLDVPVEDHIVHEDYNPKERNQYHDIALLRLAKSVPSTAYISPICLPKDDLLKRSFEEEDVYVAGWGVTTQSGKAGSNVLLKLQMKVKENAECQSIYKPINVAIQDGQLCAGGSKGKDSCRRDSGGPIMQSVSNGITKNFYALGIVSFGQPKCGLEGWPGVYTRITKYMPWIISKLKL